MRHLRLVKVVFAMGMLLTGPVRAEGLECLELIGQWPNGQAGKVALDGPTAYLGIGSALVVASLDGPTGFLEIPGQLIAIVTDGVFDYVVEEGLGVRILEIPDMGDAAAVGIVPFPDALGLALADDLLSVFSPDGLTIFDVSNPIEPFEVGGLTGFHALMGAVDGPITVIASGGGGLKIVDTSEPSTPVLVGQLADDCVRSVALSGNHAYALFCNVDDSRGLHVIDLTDPRFPSVVGYAGCDYITDIAINGSLAYVSDGYRQLCVIDVRNPSNPRLLSWTGGSAYDVTVLPDFAYTVGEQLSAFDVRNPEAPRLVAGTDMPEDSHWNSKITSSHGRVHVVTPSSGLAVYRACALPTRRASGRRVAP